MMDPGPPFYVRDGKCFARRDMGVESFQIPHYIADGSVYFYNPFKFIRVTGRGNALIGTGPGVFLIAKRSVKKDEEITI